MTRPPSPASAAIAYHDSLAEGWTRRYAAGGFKRRAEFFKQEVLTKAPASGRWLDIGCGSGVFSRMLSEGGAEALGVDGSSAMIAAAERAGGAPRYRVETFETLSRLDQNFDGVLLLSVLEYLDDPVTALKTAVARLRPGGALILSAPNRGAGVRRLQQVLRRLRFATSKSLAYLETSRNVWSRADLRRAVQSAGLDVTAVLGFDPVAPRPLWPLISPSLWFVIARKPDASVSPSAGAK